MFRNNSAFQWFSSDHFAGIGGQRQSWSYSFMGGGRYPGQLASRVQGGQEQDGLPLRVAGTVWPAHAPLLPYSSEMEPGISGGACLGNDGAGS